MRSESAELLEIWRKIETDNFLADTFPFQKISHKFPFFFKEFASQFFMNSLQTSSAGTRS